MSVQTMARVWAGSAHSGTGLLMLLAIADFADDDGRAYPSVATLARKCRMTPRNVNHILAALRDSGELEIRQNAGPGGANRYRILPKPAQPLKPASPLKATSPPEAAFTPEACFTLKPASSTPEDGFSPPLKPTSDEPSVNHQEPSDTSLARPATAKRASCPYQALIDLYHQHLPDFPRVKLLKDKRKKALQGFWTWILTSTRSDGSRRATNEGEALEWAEAYFQRARQNDFLMGRTPRTSEHANWRCDLDFLLTEKGMSQVIEKTAEAA